MGVVKNPKLYTSRTDRSKIGAPEFNQDIYAVEAVQPQKTIVEVRKKTWGFDGFDGFNLQDKKIQEIKKEDYKKESVKEVIQEISNVEVEPEEVVELQAITFNEEVMKEVDSFIDQEKVEIKDENLEEVKEESFVEKPQGYKSRKYSKKSYK